MISDSDITMAKALFLGGMEYNGDDKVYARSGVGFERALA